MGKIVRAGAGIFDKLEPGAVQKWTGSATLIRKDYLFPF
jgi:hypothetical protein